MLFACLILAHAVVAQAPAQVEIKIHHMRASKALEIIERANPNTAPIPGLEANDKAGTVSVTGTPEVVKEVQDLTKLIDVPRKRISVKVTVDSEVDKESFQISARIWNMQEWTTSDGDTGIKLVLQPRINDDNSVTMHIVCGRPTVTSLEETMRMKLGSSRTLSVGSQVSRVIRQGPDGKFTDKLIEVPEPKITIQVDK